jgi:hypothetical protein
MSLIWVLTGLFAAYLVYGFVVPSPYRRVFADGLNEDRVENGYLRPHEVIDPDEDAIAARVSEAFSEQTLRRKKLAGRDDPMFHEPHWGHTSGLLRGSLQIDRIENLPEEFRVGLFAQNRDYPAVVRIGVVKDPDLGFAVNRMAVKLEYPEPVPNVYAASGEARELDLLMVAGTSAENAEDHTFFARDGRQYDMAASLNPPSRKTLKTLSNWRNIALLLGIRRRVGTMMKPHRRAPESTAGWAGKPYYSLGPFALGDGAMKFRFAPAKPHTVADADPLKSDVAATNKKNMDAWLEAGEDAEFTLGIQLATPECIPEPAPRDPPKGVMAAEYCDIQWDETKSPYIDVGTLRLAANVAINTSDMWGSLQFNAWNTLPSMRPLGQLFRIRKHVQSAHSNVRVSHLFGRTPGEMVGKCPFSA